MNYYVLIDESTNKVLSMTETSGELDTLTQNVVRISEVDYNLIRQASNTHEFGMLSDKIVNLGPKKLESETLTPEEIKLEEIANNLNMLVELQADIIGGGI